MSVYEQILDGFRYDFWANRQWLTYVEGVATNEADLAVISHVLGAQDVWLARIEGNPLPVFPTIAPSGEALEQYHARWINLIQAHSDNPAITFQRFDGAEFTQPLFNIALHVIDHGTYHRGQLRGLAGNRGDTDFPETGQMAYFVTRV